MTSAPLSLPSIGKTGVALVFRDISDTERIHHMLGNFLANITHEFRTPLSALAVSVELLVDQGAELSSVESQELLNSLHLGVLGLQTLIDNLLESASLETGRFRVYPRPTDLNRIIREAANIMKPLQEKYSQQVCLEVSPTLPMVQADPRRMTQVLINLLSNAIKYSPDGVEIIVAAAEHENVIRVAISDQGPGVPPGYRPDLFRRLILPSVDMDKAQYGVGLGLSVVKAIVEGHDGQVGVDNRPGGGSIFWFTIPKEKEE
jgi:K+-sensing histidine kinase KdpD